MIIIYSFIVTTHPIKKCTKMKKKLDSFLGEIFIRVRSVYKTGHKTSKCSLL